MTSKVKWLMVLLLFSAQLLIIRYYEGFRFNIDCLYLITLYIAIRAGFTRNMMTALVIGLFTDYFTGGVFGVFSFARILTAFIVSETAHFIDLRKNIFVFLFIWASLLLSNAVASIFLSFTINFNFSLQLLLVQPALTAASGLLLTWPAKIKKFFDVF